jgi:hypothetical protein
MYVPNKSITVPSVKEGLLQLKPLLDSQDYAAALPGAQSLADSLFAAASTTAIPAALRFNVFSVHGLCALKLGRGEEAERSLISASELAQDVPPAAAQKNLKVRRIERSMRCIFFTYQDI